MRTHAKEQVRSANAASKDKVCAAAVAATQRVRAVELAAADLVRHTQQRAQRHSRRARRKLREAIGVADGTVAAVQQAALRAVVCLRCVHPCAPRCCTPRRARSCGCVVWCAHASLPLVQSC